MLVKNTIRLSHNILRTGKALIKASMSEGKFKVFITQPVPNETLEILKSNDVQPIVNESLPIARSEFLNRIKNIDGIFCTVNERIDKEVLDAAKNLKV
jgi:lactate dehydrogenase-like 2-hydroxyacid dehydrogenase